MIQKVRRKSSIFYCFKVNILRSISLSKRVLFSFPSLYLYTIAFLTLFCYEGGTSIYKTDLSLPSFYIIDSSFYESITLLDNLLNYSKKNTIITKKFRSPLLLLSRFITFQFY